MRFAGIGGVGRACAVGALLAAGTAAAETRTWTGGASGAWEVAANWSPAGVPAAGDTAVFSDDAAIAEGWTLPGNLKVEVAKGKTLDFNGPIAGAADATLTISAGAAAGAATVNFNASSTFQGNLDIQRGLVYGKADDAFGVASDDTPCVQLVAKDKVTKLYLTGIRNMKRIVHRPEYDKEVGYSSTVVFSGDNVLGRYQTHSTTRTKVQAGASVQVTRGVSNSGIWIVEVASDARFTLADVPSTIQYYGEGGPGPLVFACAGNRLVGGSQIAQPYVCLVNDAFLPSSDLAFGTDRDTNPSLDLNGTTQTVARLRSKRAYAYPGVVKSAQPGLVVVTDTSSFTNNMLFAGQASLEVRIAEEATATLGGESTTSGDLIASSGTVELGEKARWEGRVCARQGGVVRIRSAASLAHTARLALEGGTLELLDGVACVKELVKADGTACAPGFYAATAREGATALPGLAGEGVVSVLPGDLVVPDGTSWTWTGKAGDGKVSTPGNWCDADGVAATAERGPDLSDSGNLLHFPAAAAVVVDVPLAAKRLLFDGEGEGTVTLAASGEDGYVALYGGSFIVTSQDAAASAKKAVEIEAPFRYAGDVEMSVLKDCGVAFRGRLETIGSANLVKRGFGTLWIQGDANRLYGDVVNSNGVLYLAGKDPLGGDGVLRNYQFNARGDTYCCLSNAVVTRPVENWPEGNVGNGALVLYAASDTTNVLKGRVTNKNGHFRFGTSRNAELTFAGGLVPSNFVMPQGLDSSSVSRVRDVPINTGTMFYQDHDNMSVCALAVPGNAFSGEMFVCATLRTEVDDAVLERHWLRLGKHYGRVDLWGTTQHVANASVEAIAATTNAFGVVTEITGEKVAYDGVVAGLCGGNIKSDRPGAYIAFTGKTTYPLTPVFGGDVTFERAGTGTNVFYQANTSTGAVVVTGGCVRFAAPGAEWMYKGVAQTYRSTGGSWAGRCATVTGGTLAFDHAAAFPENGDFRLGGDGVLALAEGVSLRANSLEFLEDGAWVAARSGVWGAPGNAAASRHTARISGAGVLRVGKLGTVLLMR